MDAAQEVKSRTNIEDVVSEYVQLKRAGRNFKGLSPFTNERTPSFIVSPDKQIWHDFSSGKGGDVISFIEQVEGLDFRGSLELLARKAGVDLAEYQGQNTGSSDQKERLFKTIEAAVGYYQIQLTKHESPLRYLREKRGYEKQTLIDFRFGYSPNGTNNLAKYLKTKGFTENELLQTGLCVKRNGDVIDMFRDRIMIPLSDAQGRPVGFTARQLKDNKNSPKYINTPATKLYDKGRQLFGMSMAKEFVRKTGYVVVVEGNLDVVASHQAGVKQVVASAGTALTTYHLKTLQRFTGDVRLAFDDDRAGQEAAERTIPLAQELGIELSLITIPSGKDPDELIKKDVKLWQEVVENPVYMVDWLIEKIESAVDITTAQGKRQFTSKVLAIVKQLKDEVEQEHYLRIVADKTNTSVESINKKFALGEGQTTIRLKKVKAKMTEAPKEVIEQRLREQHLLGIFSAVPLLRPVVEVLPLDLLSEDAKNYVVTSKQLQQIPKDDEYGKMVLLLFEETYQHTDRNELFYQTRSLLGRLIDFYVNTKKTHIITQLEESEDASEHDLLKQVTEIQKLKTRALKHYDKVIKEQ
jgi:DNA primase